MAHTSEKAQEVFLKAEYADFDTQYRLFEEMTQEQRKDLLHEYLGTDFPVILTNTTRESKAKAFVDAIYRKYKHPTGTTLAVLTRVFLDDPAEAE